MKPQCLTRKASENGTLSQRDNYSVKKGAAAPVAMLVRSIFAQPSDKEAWAQHNPVVKQFVERFLEAAQLLDEAAEEVFAFTGFADDVWGQIWSSNPLERLNREIRRRTDVVGTFLN